VVGGVASALIATLGTTLNVFTLFILCSEKKLRRNPTTVLIIFMTFSNLLFTALVLPLNSIALISPDP